MRLPLIALTLIALPVSAMAQQPPATNAAITVPAADVQAKIAAAQAAVASGKPLPPMELLALAPYRANIEYRTSVGGASTHREENEFFYAIEGSGHLVTGGKLVAEKDGGRNVMGSAIEGGSGRDLAKGDWVMVPAGVAHWFDRIDGRLVLMSIKMPK
ncbi:cupin domain-containing protein [Novosphingobium sediminicola]|uniref:Mannose-6-phosphate isomerase-like protein (Cupin superfamily) n=1 Tax=Novosphingobium sediminicola TaxID=563162 RepID=A0A7W6CDA4_9SPHN|nr:cupin domain-containing protein [Novosphingobium sediminicola]MBB3954438.1 mannose-6-phosphate isomerase-like protein (cupin superfamily) [Novosphingobium sediminicola]